MVLCTYAMGTLRIKIRFSAALKILLKPNNVHGAPQERKSNVHSFSMQTNLINLQVGLSSSKMPCPLPYLQGTNLQSPSLNTTQ